MLSPGFAGRTVIEIDHVAAVVSDLEAALEGFREGTGAEHVWTYDNDEWDYRTAYLLAGSDMFTLVTPLSEESFTARFLDRRGPGLHHLGVNVTDLDDAVDGMAAAGGEVIMEDAIPGVRREATFHPTSWFGLQLQLIEWHEDVGPTARDHIEALRAAREDGD